MRRALPLLLTASLIVLGVLSSRLVRSSFAASAPPERALAAYQFVDSVGVNIHLHYHDTAYVSDFPRVLDLLKASGIRHYRNGIDPFAYDFEYQNAESLAKAGIKGDWILDTKIQPEHIDKLSVRAPNSIESFEGPNEIDDYAGPALTGIVQRFQHAIKANPALASVPIFAPSFTRPEFFQHAGDLSAYADAANTHDYYTPRWPETPAYGDTFYNCGGYGTMSFNLCLAQMVVPGKPTISTETGYKITDVPEEAIGRYIPRTLFKHLQMGVMRTYLYELMENRFSPSYGMVHGDFTPRPAYTAVSSLMKLFHDVPVPSPGTLSFSLTGNTKNLEHILFQKSDGTFLLVLWLGVQSADGQLLLTPTPQSITIKTEVPFRKATLYILDNDGGLTNSPALVNGSGISLKVTDRVSVIALPKS